MHIGHHLAVVQHTHQARETLAIPGREHGRGAEQRLVQPFGVFARNPADRQEQPFDLILSELLDVGIFDGCVAHIFILALLCCRVVLRVAAIAYI
jgi:hypothetical protein